mgnify:CR=1 FL=1
MTKQDLGKRIDIGLRVLDYVFWTAIFVDLVSYALWGRCSARWLDPFYIAFAATFMVGNAVRYLQTDKSDEHRRWSFRFSALMWMLALLMFIASYRFPVVAC